METIIDLLIVRHKMQTNSVRIHQWDAHLIPFTLLSTVPCFLILQAAAQQRLVHVCRKEKGAILLCSLLGDAFPFCKQLLI